jgi:FtsZ-binding cell division protein ZapB
MLNPFSSLDYLGKIVVGILSILILYIVLSNVNSILDKLGLHSSTAKIAEELSTVKQENTALKTQNELLKQTLNNTTKDYEDQIKAITLYNSQVLEQKDKEKERIKSLLAKQNQQHAAIASTQTQTQTTTTVDTQKYDQLSAINIQAIDEAYDQDFSTPPTPATH